MSFSESCYRIFEQSTEAYHTTDNINATVHNPYPVNSFEFYLYLKHWVDAVQWHLLNIIHQPDQDAGKVLDAVRRVEKMNQERVDLVELIDSLLQDRYKGVKPLPQATLNTMGHRPLVHPGIEDLPYPEGNGADRCFGCLPRPFPEEAGNSGRTAKRFVNSH